LTVSMATRYFLKIRASVSIQKVFDASPEGFENKCEFSENNATKRGDWGITLHLTTFLHCK
ncbi:hypothetical protein, partial [Pseudomonas sp. CCC2.2]|uniref:hypothetical protein n=1 Tax=Pseudomonas sp. CCC2.2 TaxID=3048605 RepID=UPI002B233ABD